MRLFVFILTTAISDDIMETNIAQRVFLNVY